MRISLSVLLAVAAFARAGWPQTPLRDTSTHLILAVSGTGRGVTLEPIAIRRGSRYSPLELPEHFAQHALARLRTHEGYLTVLRYGVDIGTTAPFREGDSHCGRMSAAIDPDLPDDPVRALAVEAPPAVAPVPIARRATAEESTALRGFAVGVLRAHGVPANIAAGVRLDSAAAVTVRNGELPALVTGASVDLGGGRSHDVFVVLEGRSGAYRLAYATYTAPSRENPDRRVLYDDADLDGDGTAELVVLSSRGETWSYRILSRPARQWHEVFAGGGAGCVGDR